MVCDVIFTFPDLPDRIEAHEFCLKARSPVFEQIFRMRKSGNVADNEIKIDECTPERFQQFLEFIYVDKFQVDIAGAIDLLQLSHKYKVQPLTEKCEEFLQTQKSMVVKYFNFTHGHAKAWFPAFANHSMSFKVDRAQVDGKLLPGYLLTKTVITKVNIWMPDAIDRYKEHNVLNSSVLIGDYAGPVQAGSFTIRFQKNLLNLENYGWNMVSVEPPLELVSGRTYSVIVENRSTLDSVDAIGLHVDPRVYYAIKSLNLNRETHVDLEEVRVTLMEFPRKTDYYALNLPDFPGERFLIRGVEIGLIQ